MEFFYKFRGFFGTKKYYLGLIWEKLEVFEVADFLSATRGGVINVAGVGDF